MNINNNGEKIFKISLFLVSFVLIFSFGVNTGSATSSSNIYVNAHGNDSWNGLNSTWSSGLNGPKATIKNATGTVTTNGTVHIAQGTYNEDNITINTNMTLIGENQNNTIINGQQTGNSIFKIATGLNITIINLTLKNATSSNGGTIYNGGTLIVSNSTFTGTTATNYGGAIYNGGTLIVVNSTFTNNTASYGGVIYNRGTLTFENSTFTNNTASYGGAIYIYNSGTLTVDNSTFTNNTASYGGGAIWNVGGLTVDNSTFTNNTASYGGGAILNHGTLIVENSTFTNNTATLDNGGGGAIYNYGTLTVDNSTFTGNTASNGGGGAIYNSGTLTVDNSTFTGNTAINGGAIYNSGTLTVENSTFTSNTAINGGAIYNYANNAVVNYNRIIGNSATSGSAIYNYYEMMGTVDASYNWWGSNTDPSANISGLDVTYDPWIILTVTSSPATINANGNSRITADLLHDSNGVYHDPLNGHVPDGITINFSSDTNGAVNPINSTLKNGSATTTFTGRTKGTSTIATTVDQQTITTITIINLLPTTITVNPASGLYGKIVNLTATLTDSDGNFVSGVSVLFRVNGVNVGTATTDSKGIAVLQYYITQNSGTYIVLVNYLGNDTYDVSNNTNQLTVKKSTSMIVIPVSGLKGKTVNLIATLTDSDDNPVSGANVQFSINGVIIGSVNTDSKGIATSPYSITQNSETYTILANYLGNDTYASTSNTNNLQVTNIPTAKSNPTNGLYNTTKTVTLTMNESGNIYYTINGTKPSNTSILYTGPVTIKSTTTLKFIAIDQAGNKSSIYTQTYTIDKTAPKIAITTPTNLKTGVSRTSTIILKFSENIKSSTYYNNIKVKNLTTGKYVTITKTISGNTLSIKTSARSKYTWYQIIIPKAAIKDYAGNKLVANYTSKFKTGT